MTHEFDIAVIGGGHAGIEAALAPARMGGRVVLLNISAQTIGVMSCNPAVGGLAKGHLAREVDALGGEMGRAIDACGIQFRMLNQTKGPAVWGPRAQADKDRYQAYMTDVVTSHPNITVVAEPVGRLLIEDGRLAGLETESGRKLRAQAVVITTGTFLNGLTHRGSDRREEGRYGEAPSKDLAQFLKSLDLEIGRLKTGTPCRLHRDSIDFSRMQVQPGDDVPQPFSFGNEGVSLSQIPCHLTHTTEKTHAIIRANLDRSPLFSGVIEGIGPRYCPSIEDKCVKFPDRDRHLLFIEPEGLDSPSIYVNGASSSLPADVQADFIHSIPGLEKAQILRTGYAVEYDFVQPTELYPSLELKKYANIFLAGQINGTSGYEEAAAQGLMAGINAMLKVSGQSPFVLKRSEAYIGVLIDDLVTRGVDEPYRMFTSRAEHRLMLRQDTADRRLTERGYELGVATRHAWERSTEKEARIRAARNMMDQCRIRGKSLSEHYLVPHIDVEAVKAMGRACFEGLRPFDDITLFADIKYEGYMERERELIKRTALVNDRPIPGDLDYRSIGALRIEAREKLGKILPQTLGQAREIPGISPADIQVLLVIIESGGRKARPKGRG